MRRLPLILVAALGLVAAARDAADNWIAATELPPLVAEASVEVLDRTGDLLRAYTVADGRWRLAISLDSVDPDYLAMLIAYEDRRFRRHNGVDALALARAAGQAVRHGRVVSGGSTLTMQVARLLEDSGTGHWAGKLRQMRVALALERRLTKDQILALYLNRAPFGGNLEGLRAGSLSWLGKPPRRLTPAEAALLVALPQSPEARRPDRDPAAARAARDRVLARMARAGVLAAEEAETAVRTPVPTVRQPFPALAPHLADRTRAADPLAPLHRLTVDAALQTRLESLLRRTVAPLGAQLSAALIVADHRTGEILAHLGSPDFTDTARAGYVDMTAALRSPGSTLKPLVYGLAFAEGLAHPETLIEDRPTAFGAYRPANFDGSYRGTIPVREALQASRNIPVVALAEALGPARLIARLQRAGIRPAIPGELPGLAITLGGLGLTLEDLVRLYAALANGGRAVDLHWRSDAPGDTPGSAVLPPEAAWQVADILRGVPAPPTAPQRRIAFKTGTSYGYRDAWAVGFDGAHVIAVWMGRPDGTPVPGAFGADLAAPLLFEAFARLKSAPDPLPPPPPGTLIAANAGLPPPLRHFDRRDASGSDRSGPRIGFPPHGARLPLDAARLPVRLDGGTPPFTLLADGAPVLTGLRHRETELAAPGAGFLTLSVIDANGHAARAEVFFVP
ncbi:penicillin-binding protein 1C [Rhodovulum euryhalinum]|uniref:peptidoglycan glycosyltransferase n=1 Tax=Rhodovulum euryhalinum TaxID=35805 RepID=A0A4R2KSD2_9RHOB|nr:penicillin-binding protein 1C [Rhodovulum euryhalinum]TCO69585.1 penicillin-binding protein 1C [Rhodovulum euryhalinum]